MIFSIALVYKIKSVFWKGEHPVDNLIKQKYEVFKQFFNLPKSQFSNTFAQLFYLDFLHLDLVLLLYQILAKHLIISIRVQCWVNANNTFSRKACKAIYNNKSLLNILGHIPYKVSLIRTTHIRVPTPKSSLPYFCFLWPLKLYIGLAASKEKLFGMNIL